MFDLYSYLPGWSSVYSYCLSVTFKASFHFHKYLGLDNNLYVCLYPHNMKISSLVFKWKKKASNLFWRKTFYLVIRSKGFMPQFSQLWNRNNNTHLIVLFSGIKSVATSIHFEEGLCKELSPFSLYLFCYTYDVLT